MIDRCVPSVRKSTISLWLWPMYQLLNSSAIKCFIHLYIQLKTLFPNSRGAYCTHLFGRMANQIRVVLRHKALYLYKPWAVSAKVFEAISPIVRSLDPKWTMKQSGGCWSFVISVSAFPIFSHTSPWIPLQSIVARNRCVGSYWILLVWWFLQFLPKRFCKIICLYRWKYVL